MFYLKTGTCINSGLYASNTVTKIDADIPFKRIFFLISTNGEKNNIIYTNYLAARNKDKVDFIKQTGLKYKVGRLPIACANDLIILFSASNASNFIRRYDSLKNKPDSFNDSGKRYHALRKKYNRQLALLYYIFESINQDADYETSLHYESINVSIGLNNTEPYREFGYLEVFDKMKFIDKPSVRVNASNYYEQPLMNDNNHWSDLSCGDRYYNYVSSTGYLSQELSGWYVEARYNQRDSAFLRNLFMAISFRSLINIHYKQSHIKLYDNGLGVIHCSNIRYSFECTRNGVKLFLFKQHMNRPFTIVSITNQINLYSANSDDDIYSYMPLGDHELFNRIVSNYLGG
jgi:hypothetical protein